MIDKVVTVYDSTDKTYNEDGYGNGCPIDIIEFLLFIQELVYKIPKKYVDTAYIYFEAEQFYDSPIPTLNIGYTRPHTQEELDKIEERKNASIKEMEANEKQKFYELKEKYNL